jgi:hypothetical protein
MRHFSFLLILFLPIVISEWTGIRCKISLGESFEKAVGAYGPNALITTHNAAAAAFALSGGCTSVCRQLVVSQSKSKLLLLNTVDFPSKRHASDPARYHSRQQHKPIHRFVNSSKSCPCFHVF